MRLANALPQPMTITLADGNPYQFSDFHLNAQAMLEERYNISLLNTDKDGRSGFELFTAEYMTKTATWRFLAYLLMKKHHRNITEEEVGYLITPTNLEMVCKVVMHQFLSSFPLPEDQKKIIMAELGI
jgi:hypothetical protein